MPPSYSAAWGDKSASFDEEFKLPTLRSIIPRMLVSVMLLDCTSHCGKSLTPIKREKQVCTVIFMAPWLGVGGI